MFNAADDSVVASYTPADCGITPPWISSNADWHTIDLTAMVGMSLKVRVFDNEMGGCGFLAFDHIHLSGTSAEQP